MKTTIHDLRMLRNGLHDTEELLDVQLESTYASLKRKPGNKFEFIFKAGASLKAALFNLCKTAWRTEELPERWSQSKLVQLYKGAGPRQQLSSYRFIHMKDEFQKFFGHLVLSAAKDKLFANMSKYQIGTKPGHRVQEHLFVIKSVIALYLKYDKPLVLTMYDVSKFFDRENLRDCMNELYKNEVRGKLYRLIFKMNMSTKISVQTPVGLSGERDIGESVGQGTVDGAVISAVNLDNGVTDFFRDSEDEVNYGGISLRPLLFQAVPYRL